MGTICQRCGRDTVSGLGFRVYGLGGEGKYRNSHCRGGGGERGGASICLRFCLFLASLDHYDDMIGMIQLPTMYWFGKHWECTSRNSVIKKLFAHRWNPEIDVYGPVLPFAGLT